MNELLFSVLRDTYPDVVTDDRKPRGPHDPSGRTDVRGVVVASTLNQRVRRHPRSSSLVVPILIAAVAVIAAGLATWGGFETWYIGAARDFVPPGCEQDSCMVRRLDYIRCGSLFDQSVLANDPNCQNSLSAVRGRIIAGYTIAVIAGVGLIWWTLFQRRRRKRLYEPRYRGRLGVEVQDNVEHVEVELDASATSAFRLVQQQPS